MCEIKCKRMRPVESVSTISLGRLGTLVASVLLAVATAASAGVTGDTSEFSLCPTASRRHPRPLVVLAQRDERW